MFGDISKNRIWSWNSDNSKHDDENGLWFHVCLALKKNKFSPKQIQFVGMENYIFIFSSNLLICGMTI